MLGPPSAFRPLYSQPRTRSRDRFAEDALCGKKCICTSIKPLKRRQQRLQTFLEDVYNAKRLHSSLDYVPPDEFELQYAMC
jgi:transposase InsO family protein